MHFELFFMVSQAFNKSKRNDSHNLTIPYLYIAIRNVILLEFSS